MGDKKNDFEFGILAAIGFIAIILIGIITMIVPAVYIGDYSIDLILLILCIIAVIIMGIGMIGMFVEKAYDKADHISNMNTFQEEYDEYADKLGIVKSDTQVTLIEPKYSFRISQYVWIADDCINIFPMAKYYVYNRTSSESKPDVTKLHITSIPIESILYFEEVGELRKYTTVSGGGTSLTGALIGYALADDVGAIIGSREPIKTSVVSEDDRRVELIYRNKEENIENLEFTHEAYQVFKNLLPSKELRRIINLKNTKQEKGTMARKGQVPQTSKDKLKQLKEMRDEGLITENEFLEQKKKILESF